MIRHLARSLAANWALVLLLGLLLAHAVPGEPRMWRLAVIGIGVVAFGLGVVVGQRRVAELLIQLAQVEAETDRWVR